MNKETNKIWKATIYIRISKDNGEDTLENQENVVMEHLKMLANIEVLSIKVDGGYSGLNSNRPAFQELLYEIQQGEINCIAVRDLSRLSRNYIEAGQYIQDMFPKLSVRFISIFEGFDFIKAPEYNISAMIGFRNIVNEEYSRNISQSLQSALDKIRKSGKYIGAFPVYGYMRSKNDRHRLELDPISAKVVQNIFEWKLDGMSAADIAENLEQSGIQSPYEYKKALNFHTSFKSLFRIFSNYPKRGIMI